MGNPWESFGRAMKMCENISYLVQCLMLMSEDTTADLENRAVSSTLEFE